MYTTKFQKGEYVIARNNNHYATLVGKIIAIDRINTPEHDTNNEDDDIHVDFSTADYSLERGREIEKHFKQSLEDISLDDVIMSPDMLVPINEYEYYRFARSLDEAGFYLSWMECQENLERARE
jgi:hypothetical protein